MIKVLEVISDTNIGGAGVLLHSRLRHTDKMRFSTAVLVPKESALLSRFSKDNIKCIEMKGCQNRSLDVLAVLEIVRIINNYKPDIVNTHGCMSARIAAFACGVPVRIYTRHCAFDIPKIFESSTVRKISSKVNKLLSHKIIAVADAAKKNLTDMGIDGKDIHVIINGVEGLRYLDAEKRTEIRKELGFSDDDIVVGICARLEPYKDHKCFLRAAALLCESSDKYRFLIIGEGSIRKELEAFAKSLGIYRFVRFIGFAQDVSPYINITDIQVNCSVGTETSSLALSEGMSIGKPSVASDFGGNPYMIKDGKNGILYKKGDALELAKAIEKISKDKALYQKMSDESKKRFASELNIQKTVLETERLYLSLYKERKTKEKFEKKRIAP
jgi:glycosyltransferase involved in cell wall biosynthesis